MIEKRRTCHSVKDEKDVSQKCPHPSTKTINWQEHSTIEWKTDIQSSCFLQETLNSHKTMFSLQALTIRLILKCWVNFGQPIGTNEAQNHEQHVKLVLCSQLRSHGREQHLDFLLWKLFNIHNFHLAQAFVGILINAIIALCPGFWW